MGNPNHDASGRFTSNDERNMRIVKAVEQRDHSTFFSEKEALDKNVNNKQSLRFPLIFENKKNPMFDEQFELRKKVFKENKQIALVTPHGSHLYGMSHEKSDIDFYTVLFESRRTKGHQSLSGENKEFDELVIPHKRFIELASGGTHQALETMFSQSFVGDRMKSFRNNFYVGTNVYDVYRRTIKKFALDENDVKRNRHAVRLTFNLNEMLQRGRFTSEMNQTQLEIISEISQENRKQYIKKLNKLSKIELDL